MRPSDHNVIIIKVFASCNKPMSECIYISRVLTDSRCWGYISMKLAVLTILAVGMRVDPCK